MRRDASFIAASVGVAPNADIDPSVDTGAGSGIGIALNNPDVSSLTLDSILGLTLVGHEGIISSTIPLPRLYPNNFLPTLLNIISQSLSKSHALIARGLLEHCIAIACNCQSPLLNKSKALSL